MTGSRCCRSACVVALIAGASPALAETKTDLVITLRSDNLLASGQAKETAPWQSIASREPEHESRARLALQLTEPGYWRNLSTLVLLRVEVPLAPALAGEPLAVRDASSSVAIALRFSPQLRLELRAFPFDTDYLRLGYLHALDWGGTSTAARESVFLNQQGGAPGALASFELPRAQLFAALKWAKPAQPLDGSARLWGALLGGKLEPAQAWRFDVGFGYFERPELAPGLHAEGFVEGVSVRAIWRRHVAEPELPLEPFRRPSFSQEALTLSPSEVEGDALALEATTLIQRQPLLEEAAATRLVPAPAAALYGSMRRRAWQAHAALLWRTLRFVLRNERQLLQAPSPQALEHAELRAWIGGSVTVPRLRLTPGVGVGVVLPATLETAGAAAGTSQSFLVSGASLAALPPGAARLPALAARLSLRFQASRSIALSLLADFARDPNATRPSGSGRREFAAQDCLSLQGGLQARF